MTLVQVVAAELFRFFLFDSFVEPFYIVADAIALLNKKIGVGWTSFSHTGGFVPFYAIGCQARQFGALNDNIEIPNTIRKIMKIK